ncbi:MAG: hypothetical protein A2W33_09495 [Chloroflexi bacterium RBG_16_52_11]|nr:MAG: hypothetical protein A2W33_09495 [Chloroflexi bacterium RBG_16_52_11]
MTSQFLCIHAHFYQPPREDPLTGVIPVEAGASPYQNWNERIHAECYRLNAELGNFSRISFNVGPTLFSWMESFHPETVHQIIAQDRANQSTFGVGNAIAQSYNHTILPLASYQDKVTQVFWAIREFEHRFGHKPLGMWLPETAVDIETLGVLASQGIEFTILAPWQVHADDPDVTRPYRINLPGGQKITAILYHAGLSGGISFNPALTVDADHFANHELRLQFNVGKVNTSEPQLILLASDGELYGHHQPLRDHFLARLVNGASHLAGLVPTYPALWLKTYPTQHTTEIKEATSWSCHHGIARWSQGCDCTPGNSTWKSLLRQAFDHLCRELDHLYIRFVSPHIDDAWELRNRYIDVMLGLQTVEDLVAQMAGRKLPAELTTQVHLLLEAQRERQRMYTSCGFFFEDFDRIEPKNNLAYAAQAVRLAHMATGVNLAPSLLFDLHQVVSERTGLRGDAVFLQHLRRADRDGRIVAGD